MNNLRKKETILNEPVANAAKNAQRWYFGLTPDASLNKIVELTKRIILVINEIFELIFVSRVIGKNCSKSFIKGRDESLLNTKIRITTKRIANTKTNSRKKTKI